MGDRSFFFNETATTEIYALSLHDALPICPPTRRVAVGLVGDRLQRVARADDVHAHAEAPARRRVLRRSGGVAAGPGGLVGSGRVHLFIPVMPISRMPAFDWKKQQTSSPFT